MKLKTIFLVFVLFPLLSSCGSKIPAAEDLTVVAEPTIEGTTGINETEKISTSTEPATQTPSITSIETHTSTQSATSTESTVNEDCVSLSDAPIAGVGQLFTTDLTGRSENDPFYVSFSMDELIKSESADPITLFKASPRRESLLYYSLIDRAYKITSGDIEKTLNNSPGDYVNWIDEETLVVRNLDANGLISYLYFLNPWDGEREDFDVGLPDYFGADHGLILSWGGLPLFDFSGQFLLFPGTNGIEIAKFPELTVLQSIVSSPYQYVPVWNPSGGSFVVPGQVDYSNELILFSTEDNSIKVITHFSETYSNFIIGELAWSPNGRWLAFWLLIGGYEDLENPVKTLMLLDLETETLMKTCLTSKRSVGNWVLEGMIWSPDSTQMALNTYSDPAHPSSLVLIDIEKMSVQVLEENGDLSPVAWTSFVIDEIK